MKSVHFPMIKDKVFEYRLAQKETNSILRAKYLTDLLIREVFDLPDVLWVTERETYTRDTNHKVYINGDRTGEFDREIVILGSVQSAQNVEKIEVLVRMMANGATAKHIRQAPCLIDLRYGTRFYQEASVMERTNSVHLS